MERFRGEMERHRKTTAIRSTRRMTPGRVAERLDIILY